MQSYTKTSIKIDIKSWIPLIPAILLLGITPWFIRYFVVQYPALPVDWKLEPYTVPDLFTYGKQQLIFVSGILSVIFMYFQVNPNIYKVKKNKHILLLMGSTMSWLILTSLTAAFPHMAIWGALEKFEGVSIWLIYMAFAFYIGSLAKDSAMRTNILRIILFGGLIVTGIGLTQFLSHDLIKMNWFKTLIMPKEIAETAQFVFEADRVYTTLYNPNFVAMYTATLLPLAVLMIIREKATIFKVLWSIFTILLCLNLVGSKSSGGFVGLVIATGVFITVLLMRHLSSKMQKWITFSLIGTFALVFVLFFAGVFNGPLNLAKFSPHHNLTNISTSGFQTIFEYKGKQLIAEADSNTLASVKFFNADMVQLQVDQDADGNYFIVSPDFADIKFTTGVSENGYAYVNFLIDTTNWVFLLHPNGMLYVNSMSTTVPMELSKGSGGFVGYEDFGSARGYIWSRTLPLIQASPLLGYGADNFTIAFPQNDYNMKYQMYGTPNILIDKAHNLYLQLVMNFGIPGLILILSVIGYAVKHLYAAYRSNEDSDSLLYLALILSIFAYLGAGLFYDSNLHVSPFFWTFVGFGFKDIFKTA